jgi:hypothetical protein
MKNLQGEFAASVSRSDDASGRSDGFAAVALFLCRFAEEMMASAVASMFGIRR